MKRIALLYFVFLIALTATGQNKSNEIEGLFTAWDKTDSPGGVVIVSHKNEIVFSKAYGMANLPYNVQNTEETIFNIGSVSKQFTAMGIVLLQQEGKLSFDDDIKKYLPELQNFGKAITIRNLLHHTSGLRSSPELFGLAGWRDGDAITNEDVYRYMAKQTSLNFETNSEYMYSNTGYILLAKIIETVAKQDFKTWIKDRIFTPLEMKSTFIEEDYSLVGTKIATSYSQVGSNSFGYVENFDLTYGASNVYSNTKDLLHWSKKFYKAPKEWENAFQQLATLDVLSSGKQNTYAFGIFVDDFYGNKRIQHSGGIAGFRSIMYCYPDEDLEIVILSNNAANQVPKIADQISQFFLENKVALPKEAPAIVPIVVAGETLKKYEGMYWSDKKNYSRKLSLENDVLYYVRSNNTKSPLLPISEFEFQIGGINEKLLLRFDAKCTKMELVSADNTVEVFERYEDKLQSEEGLSSYVGDFYSSELETTYTISLKDGKLYGYHSRFGSFEIKVLKDNVLDWSGMAISKYKRNSKGKVVGFSITMNRIRDLWFEKKNNN